MTENVKKGIGKQYIPGRNYSCPFSENINNVTITTIVCHSKQNYDKIYRILDKLITNKHWQ